MIDLATTLWPLLSWLLVASCKSVVVIALVLLCRRLFAPWLSARDRHRLWLAVIACLILPFGPQIDADLGNLPALLVERHPIGTVEESDNVNAHPVLALDPAATPTAARENEPISLMHLSSIDSSAIGASKPSVGSYFSSILVVAWLIVAAFLFVLTQWNLVRYFRIKAQALEVEAATAQLFLACKAELVLRRDVRLLETSQISSPAIFGWWSPTLLLPLDLANELSASQLRHVFLHELAHVQRNDILINWLATLVQILHWFNPLVWYAFHTMRNDMEQACDAKAIRDWPRSEQVAYGSTLIRLADFYPKRLQPAHGAGIAESHSQLRARIRMIAQIVPARVNRTLLAVLVLTAITTVAVTQPRTDSDVANQVTIVDARQTEVARQPILIERVHLAKAPTGSKIESSARVTQSKSKSQIKENDSPKVVPEPIRLAPAAEESVAEVPLRTEYRRLNYAKAYDLALLIKPIGGPSLFSERGNLIVDERTNTLVLRDTVERLTGIQQVLGALDIPVQRVQLGMRIILVDSDLRSDLIAQSVPTGMNDPRTLLGAVTIPPTNQEFDAKLSAALGSGRAEMVAMPRVVTNNGKEAMIQQDIEFPAQQSSVESSKGIPVAKIRKAVLTLKITPKVAANNRIELDLDALMHDFDSSEKGETHRIVTKAEMNDGYTVVLDGLLLVEKPDSGFPAPISKTPKSRRQLVVLLTPTLLPKQEPLYPTTL